jgi:hypothetical protein
LYPISAQRSRARHLRKEKDMGTYKFSNQELYDAITNCLDLLEGDFTRAQLITILDEIKHEYPYVSDSKEEHKSASTKSAKTVPNKARAKRCA